MEDGFSGRVHLSRLVFGIVGFRTFLDSEKSAEVRSTAG